MFFSSAFAGATLSSLTSTTSSFTSFVAFLIRFLLISSFGGEVNEIVDMVLSYFVSVNLGFAVFNMLPIPPLDGSRVLYAIAPDIVRSFMAKIESFGIWVIYGLILIFGSAFSGIMVGAIEGIYNFFLWIVGL